MKRGAWVCRHMGALVRSVLALTVSACGAARPAEPTSNQAGTTHSTATPHTSAASSQMLATCVSAPLSRTVPRLRCDGLELRFMRSPTLGDAAGLDALEAQISRRGPTEATTLEGPEGSFAARVGDGFAIGVPWPGIMVLCVAPGAACTDHLTALSHGAIPEDVHFPSTEELAAFRGRTVTVPSGCQRIGNERVACATGVLDWRDGSGPRRTPEEALEDYVQLVARRGGSAALLDERVTCTLAGEAAVGRRTQWARPEGLLDIVMCSLVASDGTPAVATCMGTLARGAPPPVPCDQLFDGPLP